MSQILQASGVAMVHITITMPNICNLLKFDKYWNMYKCASIGNNVST